MKRIEELNDLMVELIDNIDAEKQVFRKRAREIIDEVSEVFTADEIKKALELVSEHCENAHLRLTYQGEPFQVLVDKTINLINHYEAELEKKSAALGALLCHATGGKLSKDTYPMPVMGRAVTNYIEDCFFAQGVSFFLLFFGYL